MTIYAESGSLITCCGINEFGGFTKELWGGTSIQRISLGGANLAVAAFINTKICQDAYEELKAKFNILYQSPLMYNLNSGRELFLVVYGPKT